MTLYKSGGITIITAMSEQLLGHVRLIKPMSRPQVKVSHFKGGQAKSSRINSVNTTGFKKAQFALDKPVSGLL